MILVRAVASAVALVPFAQCTTTITLSLQGVCEDDNGTDGNDACNGGTLITGTETVVTGDTATGSSVAGAIAASPGIDAAAITNVFSAAITGFIPTVDNAGSGVPAPAQYCSTTKWVLSAAEAASPATLTAGEWTRDITVTLVDDWLEDSKDEYDGDSGTHISVGRLANVNTVFGSAWTKNKLTQANHTMWVTGSLSVATWTASKSITSATTNAVDGRSRTFTGGFKTVLSLVAGTAGGTVAVSNIATETVGIANSSCDTLNTLLIGFHTASNGQTDSHMIACSADAVTSDATHTVTMYHSSEYDMKWVAAALSTLTADDSANTDGLLFVASSYGLGATLTSVSIHDLDGSEMSSSSQSTYGATVEVSKASVTFEADEACMQLLKALRRRAFHSVWASCSSTASASAGAVSTATMTFYHEHDIAATLRALYDVFENDVTLALTSVKPAQIKDGSVTDADGAVTFASVPSVSVTWYNTTVGTAAGAAETKTGLAAVANSACSDIEDKLSTALTSNTLVWCDDGSAAAGSPAADGATVTLYFGSRSDLWTLRAALTTKRGGYDTNVVKMAAEVADLSPSTYKVTFELTAASGSTIIPTATATDQTEVDPFKVGSSGCKFADVGTAGTSQPMWCSSDATTMTLFFATPAQAKAGAQVLYNKAMATPFQAIVPTGAKDLSDSTELLHSITYAATRDSASTEWTETGATSACGNAATTESIYCTAPKGTGVDMSLYYLTEADFITDGKLNAEKTSGSITADSDTLVQQYVPKDGDTYTVKYDITLKPDADGATTDYTSPSRGELTRAGSACNAYKKSNAIFCVSNVNSSMTLHYTSATKRKTDSLSIAASASATPALSAKPTTVKDLAVAVPLLSVKYLANYDTDAAEDAWLAANGSTNTSGSACKEASAAITAVNNMITYCDSAAASGSEMELLFFSLDDARTTMRDLKTVASGSGDKAVRAFVPVASQFYEAAYTLSADTDADGEQSEIDAQGSSTAGNGCTYLSSTRDIYCECDTTTATQYFLTAADRLTDMAKSAKFVAKSAQNIGSVMVSGVVNKDLTGADTSVGSLVSIAYTANDDNGAAWESASSGGPATGSACAAASGLSSCVACESAAGTGALMTLKWVASASSDYIADARKLSGKTNTDKSQIFTLGESTTPETVVTSFDCQTTTAAPASRILTATFSSASTGGFGTDDSWCKALGDVAVGAIFCTSTAADSGVMSLSYLDGALASADAKSLAKLKNYDVAPKIDAALQIVSVFTVTKDLAKDALCTVLFQNIPTAASCAHDAVTIATDDAGATDAGATGRRLSSQQVAVTLGFVTPAALDAGTVAASALVADPSSLAAAGVSGVATPTMGDGSPLDGAPATTTAGPEGQPEDDDGTSTAGLRIGGLLGLLGFMIA